MTYHNKCVKSLSELNKMVNRSEANGKVTTNIKYEIFGHEIKQGHFCFAHGRRLMT